MPPTVSRREASLSLGTLWVSATGTGRASAQVGGDAAPYPIRAFGYIGDGRRHPLSGVDAVGGRDTRGWSLEQWRTLFPRALSLDEEIDRHAIQAFCDAHPDGVALDLPAGIAIIDRGIVTGGRQHVHLRGAGRDLTELWFFEPGGICWAHGHTNPADGTWAVVDLTVRPKAICAAAFDVRFSGRQPAWCHILRDVQFVPADGVNYFENACVTANIKRGLDWRNVVAYGHHFHILSSNAFEFPANADQTAAGDSYNFDNVMSVGYAYAINFDFTGFVAPDHHMHEEAQLYNVQAYVGVGLLRADNGNLRFAPADNFTLQACGWQGRGPALDLRYLEHVRVRDTLFVNDAVDPPSVAVARITDCDSVIFDGNEVFSPAGHRITGIEIRGEKTRNVVLTRTDVVAYSHFDSFLMIAPDVPEGGVEERATRFAGTATYDAGKIDDRSGRAVSETRALERAAIASATPPRAGTQSVSIDSSGDIVWDAILVLPVGDDGACRAIFPPSLFRSIKSASAEAENGLASWAMVASVDPKGAVIRFPAATPPAGTSVTIHVRAIGR